jgi:hypothetical protein
MNLRRRTANCTVQHRGVATRVWVFFSYKPSTQTTGPRAPFYNHPSQMTEVYSISQNVPGMSHLNMLPFARLHG